MIIGIAVVEKDGRFLVGVRDADVALAGHSEFPGGKCEPGESPADAAVRECREETGLMVETVDLIARHTHTYAHGTVDLHFWRCRLSGESAGLLPQNGFRWVPTEELATLNFPDANVSIIATLAAQ